MLRAKHLFGTNGIRGLANKELTPEIAIKIGAAIGIFFKRGTLAVGYDARTSGPMLAKAVIAGLNSTGCNVLLAGMAPTPTLQFAVKKHKADGGVIITASHNPPAMRQIPGRGVFSCCDHCEYGIVLLSPARSSSDVSC